VAGGIRNPCKGFVFAADLGRVSLIKAPLLELDP
jgi:hypothetical protein